MHVASAENSIGDHDGQKNLRCSGRETQVDMHVPETGNEILAATVYNSCAARDSEGTIAAHRCDGPSPDLDGHVG